MHGFWKQKIDFLTLDKIFVLDNLNIVLDKKYFVRADGRGITIRNIDKACDTAPPCSYGPVIETERLIGRLGLRKITLVA